MASALLKFFSLSLLASTLALVAPVRRASVAYIAPASNGGSQLDSSAGLGEPLNIIISALSSLSVLSVDGLQNWARSVNYSTECLGQHSGNPQTANTGDGRGWTNELGVIRFDYGDVQLGTCLESLIGGNHFRYWQQTTTGAFFLATSNEEPLKEHHTISPNGYDRGRDELVEVATGITEWDGVTYNTTSYYVDGLLTPGNEGINHNITIDGRVVVLTIITS